MDLNIGMRPYLERAVNFMLQFSFIVFLDGCIYTYLVPISAAWVGGRLAVPFGADPPLEVVLVTQTTFLMAYVACSSALEGQFSERLLRFDDTALLILDIRAFYNIILTCFYTIDLVQSVQHLAGSGPMKSSFWSEHVELVALGQKLIYSESAAFLVLPTGAVYELGPTARRDLEAAQFILRLAYLFSSIAHLLYLNTLYGQLSSLRELGTQLEEWIAHLQLVRITQHAEDLNNNNLALINANHHNDNNVGGDGLNNVHN